MKAIVFHKPKDVRYENVDKPRIRHVRDAIIRVTRTAICGSDLHIYNGFFPQATPLVLGHEFMGIVEEVGPRVANLKAGDRVVVPFPIACGQCWFCARGLPTACELSNPGHYGPEGGLLEQKGGGLFGYTDLYGGYPGGQAEYVRVPFADVGPRKVAEGLGDEQALFLSDILPTGWSACVWGGIKGGETVAVFGCGPVGLMALKSARFMGASRLIGIDPLPYRLAMARRVSGCEPVNPEKHDPIEAIREMTGGRGADVVIDAVGMEADRTLLEKASNVLKLQAGTSKVVTQAMSAVRRGGVVSVVGVYGTKYDVNLGQMLDKGLTIRAGQAPVHVHIDGLMELVREGKIVVDDIITHRLPLAKGADAYRVFNDKEENCVKCVLTP
jgi:S-(hydroxymethyl)glutathione dehydrogenase / alcohol dehydrogenase